MKNSNFLLLLLFGFLLFSPIPGRAELREYRMKSALLGNQRPIYVYLSKGYSAKRSEPYHLLFIFDGEAYTQIIPTPKILDDLIAEEKIEPVVAVFIGSIDRETRERELPCNPLFTQFLTQELLPWVHRQFHVTHESSHTAVAGSSYGGLAACFAALTHPEIFGNVLSQSGAFWWNEGWLVRQLSSASRLPGRIYLDVGKSEIYPDADMVKLHRDLCEKLRARECEIYYEEFDGGHEYPCWEKTLPKGLIILFPFKRSQRFHPIKPFP